LSSRFGERTVPRTLRALEVIGRQKQNLSVSFECP
jgi:hypothetical protein